MKRYEVEINGMTTTLQLSDAEAKARGLLSDDDTKSKAKAPANKAKTPANKSAAADKREEAASKAFGGKQG